jgi:hypothetical protein
MGVLRFEIDERVPFADGVQFGDVGSYERLSGRVHFAVDPLYEAYAPVQRSWARCSASYTAALRRT